MYLFNSWSESISLFKAGNLKLLFLVTLNNIRRHYKFFLVFIFLFLVSDSILWKDVFGVELIWLNLIQFSLFLYMPFIFVLILRPSIKRKSFRYLLDYKWHILFWLFIPIIFIIYDYYGALVIRDFIYMLFNLSNDFVVLNFCVILFILPAKIIETFFALFWLDSRSNFKQIFLSLWRATKMFTFNLPLYLIFFVIPYLCYVFFVSYFIFIFGKYWVIFITYFLLLVYIFYTSFLVNFYTKNIHDKFSVYFRN